MTIHLTKIWWDLNKDKLVEQVIPEAEIYKQEPVTLEAVYETIIQWDEGGGKRSRRELARRIVALYTTPPRREWVGLTDEEHMVLYVNADKGLHKWARAIEAKLKEKNA